MSEYLRVTLRVPKKILRRMGNFDTDRVTELDVTPDNLQYVMQPSRDYHVEYFFDEPIRVVAIEEE